MIDSPTHTMALLALLRQLQGIDAAVVSQAFDSAHHAALTLLVLGHLRCHGCDADAADRRKTG
jgi:hypothetical protein